MPDPSLLPDSRLLPSLSLNLFIENTVAGCLGLSHYTAVRALRKSKTSDYARALSLLMLIFRHII